MQVTSDNTEIYLLTYLFVSLEKIEKCRLCENKETAIDLEY